MPDFPREFHSDAFAVAVQLFIKRAVTHIYECWNARNVHRKPAVHFFCLDWIADRSKRLVGSVFVERVGHGFLENDTCFHETMQDR